MPKETRIIMFRHGETDWNKHRKWQGHSDIPLNATGYSQAKKLAEVLAVEPIDHIFSSDLSRAVQTAEAVSKTIGCQISTDKRLREIDLGEGEGLLRTQTAELFGDGYLEAFFSNHDLGFRFPNGETKGEHRDRLVELIKEVAPEFVGKTIALSSHGGSMHRVFCAYWHDLSQKIKIPNCSYMVFNVNIDLEISFLDKSKLPFCSID